MKIIHSKIVLVVLLLLIVFVGIYAAWKLYLAKPSASPVTQAALAQLQADLQSNTAHFIDASKTNEQSLTPAEQKIKDDVVALFTAEEPVNADNYSQLWLDAVGKRYILISQWSADSSFDVIVDSKTGKVTPISDTTENAYYLASEGRNVALYIGTQAIYTYTLDQDSVALVQGSQLSGNETYHSGAGDFHLDPVQTHTKDSITISVFDSSKIVQNPNAQPKLGIQTMSKKVRDLTLSF